MRIIDAHANGQEASPFFIYAAFQALHAPLEAPQYYLDSPACKDIGEVNRHIFCAMAQALDSAVGNITSALSAGGFSENTVIVWSTDKCVHRRQQWLPSLTRAAVALAAAVRMARAAITIR